MFRLMVQLYLLFAAVVTWLDMDRGIQIFSCFVLYSWQSRDLVNRKSGFISKYNYDAHKVQVWWTVTCISCVLCLNNIQRINSHNFDNQDENQKNRTNHQKFGAKIFLFIHHSLKQIELGKTFCPCSIKWIIVLILFHW